MTFCWRTFDNTFLMLNAAFRELVKRHAERADCRNEATVRGLREECLQIGRACITQTNSYRDSSQAFAWGTHKICASLNQNVLDLIHRLPSSEN